MSEMNADQTPQKERDTIDLIRRRKNAFSKHRSIAAKTIRENRKAVFGQQHGSLMTNEATHGDRAGDTVEARMADVNANRIMPLMLHDVAMVTKDRPRILIMPGSSSAQDKRCAKAHEQLKEHLHHALNLTDLREQIYIHFMLGGSCIAFPHWQKNFETAMTDPETGRGIGPGEAVCTLYTDAEVVFDTRIRQGEDYKHRWVIYVDSETVGDLKDEFPDKKDALSKLSPKQYGDAEPSMADVDVVDSREDAEGWMSGQRYMASHETVDCESGSDDRAVIVDRLWERPSAGNPNGRRAVVVNAELVLVDEAFPEKYRKKLPFIRACNMQIATSVNGVATVSHQVPIQRERNHFRRAARLGVITSSGGKYLIPEVDGQPVVMPRTITTDEGVMVVYKYAGGAKPEWQQGLPLNPAISEMIRMCDQDMQFVGTSDVSRGIVPFGAPRTGVGIDYLQQADASKYGPGIRTIEKMEERLMEFLLMLCDSHYTAARKIAVLGENRQYTLRELRPEELAGNYSVRIVTGSSLPRNEGAVRRDITGAIQMGLLGDTAHPVDGPVLRYRALELLNLPGAENFYEQFGPHIQAANEEWRRLEQGEMPRILPSDHHAVHISEFRDLITEHRFDDEWNAPGQPQIDPETGMPGGDPATGQPMTGPSKIDIASAHIDEHKTMMLNELMQTNQATGQVQTPPPGAQGAPPPPEEAGMSPDAIAEAVAQIPPEEMDGFLEAVARMREESGMAGGTAPTDNDLGAIAPQPGLAGPPPAMP